jgi:hypothetical protein
VTGDLEIATEVWVTPDVWSRQRQRIHERRIKPIAKIDSCLTHGIVKPTMRVLMHKSSPKTKSLKNEKSSLKIKTRVMDGIPSKY